MARKPSSRRRSSGLRAAGISPWGAVITAFVLLCLSLGGSSSGGLVANSFLQVVSTVLLAFVVTRLGAAPLSRDTKFLFAIIGCWIVMCLVQLVPLPPSLWTMAPGRDLLEQRLRTAGINLPWLPLTLSPAGTLRHLASLMPPLAAGALVLWRPPEDANGLRWAIPLVAIASLMIGVGQILGGPDSRLYFYSLSNISMPVGIMANANHQATLLLCAIPFVASLASSETSRSAQSRGRDIVLVAIVAMLLIGIALCYSYAAYILVLPVLIASWLIARPRSLGQGRYVLIGAAVLTIAVIALVFVAGPDMLDTGVPGADKQFSRPTMYAVAAHALAHFFPLGSGPGSFVPVYKLFEDPGLVINVFANHAHSDYLELALETGIPGVLLVLGLLVWWARRAVSIWFSRSSSRLDRAAIVATAAIMAHSLVDYPARTSTIAVILAAGFALMTSRAVTIEEDEAPGGGRHLTAE